jgi:hypothetical protein
VSTLPCRAHGVGNGTERQPVAIAHVRGLGDGALAESAAGILVVEDRVPVSGVGPAVTARIEVGWRGFTFSLQLLLAAGKTKLFARDLGGRGESRGGNVGTIGRARPQSFPATQVDTR